MTDKLIELYKDYFDSVPELISKLPLSGSNRRYYRLNKDENSPNPLAVIGVVGSSIAENEAFFYISNHLKTKGFNVPEVYAISEDRLAYIQEDLGGTSLFDIIKSGGEELNDEAKDLALKTISQLPRMQILGAEDFDFNKCYPIKSFGERQINFDLNYFKYCFLKTQNLDFNESLLEDEFDKLRAELLSNNELQGFLYRDFQSRNVLIKDSEPYFIDFQGGSFGPIHYDLASFVLQARAGYSDDFKQELVSRYVKELKKIRTFDEEEFHKSLWAFSLFRTLQVLGAYGFRGNFEGKSHFILSIPLAIKNLKKLLLSPYNNYPYLTDLVSRLEDSHEEEADELIVDVLSFSYHRGLPKDASGNGGGYVFDCRAVHNPGRYAEYKQLTGMDAPVIDFLEKGGEIIPFLDSAYSLVDSHINRYMERGFKHLMIAFGCTGGQHRSVYSAESMAKYIVGKFGLKVRLQHREQKVERLLVPNDINH